MAKAVPGNTVNVHYTGKLDNGAIFDTSRTRHPLQFTIGKGQVIPGFEQAVIGMHPGETKTTTVSIDLAYGMRRDDMIVTMERSQFPADMAIKVGQRLELTQMDDQKLLVTVIAMTDTTMTLDANHPLAGKELIFDIELLSIT